MSGKSMLEQLTDGLADTELGRKTVFGTLLLVAFGGYCILTGDSAESWDSFSSAVKQLLGGMSLILAFVFFGIRVAVGKVLRRLDELEAKIPNA